MAQASARKSTAAVKGGSAIESLAAIGAIVLAVLGLIRVLPQTMAAIGAIVLGGALLLEGGLLGSGRAAAGPATHDRAYGATRSRMQLGGAASAEFLGGVTGVVLGLLVLIGAPAIDLLAAASIVLGAAVLVSGLRTPTSAGFSAEVVEEGPQTASGAQILVGLGAITLGILALLGVANPLMLILISFLALGACLLINSTAIGSAAGVAARHHPQH